MNDGARFALREATAGYHERVDAAFGGFDLAEAEGYGGFLRAHARALIPAEAALDAAGAERLLPSWPRRRRAHRLIDDLAALGLAPPPGIGLAGPDNAAAAWGMLYVLEGSRLGGAMLVRAVGPGLPRSYLDPGRVGADWRNFLAALEVSLCDRVAVSTATVAAADLFKVFEHAARLELEASI